ncbi:tetratricopeptide repeat-containing protein [Rhizorhabdus sp. FW153]|uniref:tetratricopeptide repeat-containing protein n=1 Tax=Rhizorhabdus sp. FW153 TaxID=3400216 RepID=UPI003CEC5F88
MLTPHTEILRLARSGSSERAWALMAQHGLLDSDSDPRALTLQARLIKDGAKRARTRAERTRLFAQSAQLYANAARLNGSSYPLVNAASLSLFAGKPAQARRFAADVLKLIEADPGEGETPYWREATRAEALLLLDREVEARVALSKAIALQPHAWEDHAATIGQFVLIAAEKGWNAGWLDVHRPPPSVHFSGIVGLAANAMDVRQALARWIAGERPGFAYGALAAGADLLFAEAFIAWRDSECPAAELHVVLPYPVDQFRQISVAAFGDHWLLRFDSALAQATSTTVYGLDDPSLPLAVDYADRVAMGRALRNAAALASQACAVTVVGAGERLRPQLAGWRDAGRTLTIIEGKRGRRSEPAPTCRSLKTLVWAGDGDWSAHEDLLVAGKWARELSGAKTGVGVALVVTPCDTDAPPAALLQRAAALAAVAVPTTVVSDDATAMALLSAGWSSPVEELGELLLPSGLEPVWSVFKA